MIEKVYEVSCDNCGTTINHYIGNRPTKDELKSHGVKFYKGKLFCCDECLEDHKKHIVHIRLY